MDKSKKYLIVLLALVLVISVKGGILDRESISNELDSLELDNNDLDNLIPDTFEFDELDQLEIEERDFLLSWQARRSVQRILKQMPCGWPDQGIPPLAPYEVENFTLDSLDDLTNLHALFQPLHINGLNDVNIDKLSVSYSFQKRIRFNFNFPNITASGRFNLSSREEPSLFGLGKGAGSLNLSLENVRLNGSFKYKLPFLLGSAKIYDLRTSLTLGNVRSKLKGTLNGIPITRLVNRAIERLIMRSVNDNQIFLSSMLEQLLVPRINSQLEGKKLWNVISWSLGMSPNICIGIEEGLRDFDEGGLFTVEEK